MYEGKYRAYVETSVGSQKQSAIIRFFRLLALDQLNRRAI